MFTILRLLCSKNTKAAFLASPILSKVFGGLWLGSVVSRFDGQVEAFALPGSVSEIFVTVMVWKLRSRRNEGKLRIERSTAAGFFAFGQMAVGISKGEKDGRR